MVSLLIVLDSYVRKEILALNQNREWNPTLAKVMGNGPKEATILKKRWYVKANVSMKFSPLRFSNVLSRTTEVGMSPFLITNCGVPAHTMNLKITFWYYPFLSKLQLRVPLQCLKNASKGILTQTKTRPLALSRDGSLLITPRVTTNCHDFARSHGDIKVRRKPTP